MVGGAQVIMRGGVIKGTENKSERGPLLLGENTQCVLMQLLHLMSASKTVTFNV